MSEFQPGEGTFTCGGHSARGSQLGTGRGMQIGLPRRQAYNSGGLAHLVERPLSMREAPRSILGSSTLFFVRPLITGWSATPELAIIATFCLVNDDIVEVAKFGHSHNSVQNTAHCIFVFFLVLFVQAVWLCFLIAMRSTA